MKAKQLDKGVDQLMDEGVAQLFTLEMNRKIIGTVGALQYEVIQYRLDMAQNVPMKISRS
jgi:peptide chain release factor 3